ncbi:MAG: autotransporter-associated beta strand repeat-containing protein [Pirellulales bacterium]|nr:autotransporter-associated beta strand repeat-containing protein [Pirellulales bacterium]
MHRRENDGIRKILAFSLGVALTGLVLSPAGAVVITRWNFNDENTLPDIGSGTFAMIGGVVQDAELWKDGSSTDPGSPNKAINTTNYPAQGTGNKTAGIEIAVDTTAYDNISVTFDLRTSNTSSRYYRAQYSLDGSSWTDSTLFTSAGGDEWNNLNTIDLSSISGANDNPNFKFRVVSEFAPGTSAYQHAQWDNPSKQYQTTGKYRFDMITVWTDEVVAPGAEVIWNTTSGNWNTTENNWIGGDPDPNKFRNYDQVYFNDIATDSIITIDAGGVNPYSTSVSNVANTYTFTGGAITGGSLTKSSTGTLVLAAANAYPGGTTVNGGLLIVQGGDNRLGSAGGSLTLNGGTLQTNATGLTSARPINIGGNGGTFNTNGFDSSTTAHTDINGTLTKTGAGNLALNETVSFDNSGRLIIESGGSVTFGGVNDKISMWNGGVFNGDLILALSASVPPDLDDLPRLNFDADESAVPFTGTGAIKVQNPGITLSNDNDNSYLHPIHVYVDIHLNSLGQTFTKTDVTREDPLAVANPFVTMMGGTRDKNAGGESVPNNLHYHNPIAGDSDVHLANDPAGLGSGNVYFDAQNTYTGATMLNGDHSATLFLGVDDALPVTTDVIFGTGSAVKSSCAPQIDLNGHNQQINSLSHGPYEYASKMGTFGITNSGSDDSVLKVSGSTTPYNSFGGVISDGTTHTVSLEKDGASTLSLSNVNTYTGPTVVHEGVLELARWIDPDFGGIHSTGGISLDSPVSTDAAGTFQIREDIVTEVGTISGTGTTNVLDNAQLTVAAITQGAVFTGDGAGLIINGETNSVDAITGTGSTTLQSGTLTAASIVQGSLTIGGGPAAAAQPVPEPGVWTLITLAAGMWGWLRRRR